MSTQLLTQNGKMKKSSEKIWNFGIPAFKSKDGFSTCPKAGACAKGCYAMSGAYMFSNVARAFEWRLEQTFKPEFINMVQLELNIKKVKYLRIHDSGDFYSLEYLMKWIEIMHANPAITFYAYTKQVKMIKDIKLTLPKNFIVIFSFGGLEDNLINTEIDRHSLVFPSEYALKKAGYVNAANNDAIAFQSINPKIGLVFHHAKNIENTSWGMVLNKQLKKKDKTNEKSI